MRKAAAAALCLPVVAISLYLAGSGAPFANERDPAHAIAEKFAGADEAARKEAQVRAEAERKAAEARKAAAEAKRREAARKAADAKRRAVDADRRAAQLKADEADMLARARAEADERRAELERAEKELARAEAEREETEAKAKAEEADRIAAEQKAAEQRKAAEEASKRAEVERQAREAEVAAAEKSRLAAAEAEKKNAEKKQADEERRAREAKVAEDARAAELRKAEDEKRRAEIERVAQEAKAIEDARLAAERKAEEAKKTAEAQLAEDRRRAEAERAAEAKAKEVADRWRERREGLGVRSLDDKEPRVGNAPPSVAGDANDPASKSAEVRPAVPAAAPETKRADAGVATKGRRATILIVMAAGDKGIRRFEKTADPMLCLPDTCFISAGAGAPAEAYARAQAFGPGIALGKRAGACRHSLGCVFRGIDLGEGKTATLQPIDLRIVRHDRRETSEIAIDTTCTLAGGRLDCGKPVRSGTYTAWIVPEELAEKAGADLLDAMVGTGLGAARAEAVRNPMER